MESLNGENGTSNGDSNGHAPKMLSLEIEADEEEHQSLLRETSEEVQDGSGNKKLFLGRNAHGIRRRMGTEGGMSGSKSPGAISTGAAMIQGFLRTDLMSHAVYHLRNALVLAVLAFFVLIVLEWEGGILRSEVMEEEDPVSPHTFSFGGKLNWGHNLEPYKPRTPLTAQEEADLEDEILEEATEKGGTWDIAMQNRLNEEAHYLHDPEKSPFASSFYLAEDDELDDRQRRFAKRMGEIVEKFGVWNNPKYENAIGQDDDFFEEYEYRDVPVGDFPSDAWQTDEAYIRSFLQEAQALVEATKEGIMQEYNHPNPDDEEKNLFGVIIGDQHDFINGTAHHNETKTRLPGVAYLPEQAWNGLVRKLLHAMVTSDHFYVVVAGGDETYKANNFAKTQVMQFNYIMEPIFHKLGMTLISRNMGISASTAVSALGGADIFGETDILWHVERIDAEEKPGEFDLLQKQSIMSGERIPIILSPQWDELMQASKGKAWVGNIQPGVDFCQKTTMDVLPDAPACHNVHCDTAAWESRKCYVYDSVCWELREDWNPDSQVDNAGDQDRDYPGYRRHQLEGRKMTLLLLHALNAAIESWLASLDDDRSPLPLATELWHVGDVYESIRETVMSLDRIPGQAAGIPACERLLKEVDARICHVPMHAYTEWTPRVVPATTSLLSIINNLVRGTDGENELYDGPDIVPLAWRLPDDEMDVHMIAIAANVTPGYDDDLFGGQYLEDDWGNYDDLITGDGVDGGDDPVRRLRREGVSENEQQRALKKRNQKPPPTPAPTPPPTDPPGEGKDKNPKEKTQESDQSSDGGDGGGAPDNSNGEGEGKGKGEGNDQKQDEGKGKGKDNSNNARTQVNTKDANAVPKIFDGEHLEIAEGFGWQLSDAPVGFCDGSAQSRCNRQINNMCLLANHNHYQGNLVGGPKNSWLTMRVPGVKHGIILARIAFEGSNGSLNLPLDLLFDYAVNGVVKTIQASELQTFGKEIVSGLRVFPLVNGRDAVVDGEDFGVNFEVAIRIRSTMDLGCVMRLSHIYFA